MGNLQKPTNICSANLRMRAPWKYWAYINVKRDLKNDVARV